jgi:hypothetical protein
MNNQQEEIKAQIALLKVEEKRLKSIQKIKDKNTAFNMRMLKEYGKSPVNMIIWVWRLEKKSSLFKNVGINFFISELKKLNFTFEKVKNRNDPDRNQLLNLEQGIELLCILDKEVLIPEFEAKFAELNNFTQLECCICLTSKCETEMCKMRRKIGDVYQLSCECKTDICGECIQKIHICPTCREEFTHRTWVK